MKNSKILQSVSLEEQSMRRLLMMRNLLIIGEISAVAIFSWWQKLAPTLTPLILLWIIMTVWNYLTYLKVRQHQSLNNNDHILQLSFDIFAFTVFLYLTGGATNPLGWYYLVPIMLSATLLPKKYTLMIAVACIVFYLLLLKYYIPLPGFGMEDHSQHAMHTQHTAESAFSLHVFGMWFGFLMSALLIAWFISDLAYALRERDKNLSRAREQAMKDEQLVAMATLATGAAHELGTPLGTMMLISESLAEDYPQSDYPELNKSATTLREQVVRCKEAISLITASVGESNLEGGSIADAGWFLDDTVRHWQQQRKGVDLIYEPQTHRLQQKILADRTVSQALINVLNNAADVSPDYVEVVVSSEQSSLIVDVFDKGGGYPEDFNQKLGTELISSKADGLGIGLLLAHATIRRIGGEILCLNEQSSDKTCTRIKLPVVKR